MSKITRDLFGVYSSLSDIIRKAEVKYILITLNDGTTNIRFYTDKQSFGFKWNNYSREFECEVIMSGYVDTSLCKILKYLSYMHYNNMSMEEFINILKCPIEDYICNHDYAKKIKKSGISISSDMYMDNKITDLISTDWHVVLSCTDDKGNSHRLTKFVGDGKSIDQNWIQIDENESYLLIKKDIYYEVESFCQLVSDAKLVSKKIMICDHR